jgi:hypothetical protein
MLNAAKAVVSSCLEIQRKRRVGLSVPRSSGRARSIAPEATADGGRCGSPVLSVHCALSAPRGRQIARAQSKAADES